MTALVTKHLPLVVGAPDGIKKLRALILDLAVSGRLLPIEREPQSGIPVGWTQATLGSLFTFEYGDNLPAAMRSNTGEYPVYGSNGVVGTHNVSFVQYPCIVIGRKGSAGALNLCASAGCCVTDVAYYCIPPQSMSLEYTFKLLHSLGLDTLGKGIKPGLNRNEAYALDILVPPLDEQHCIVAKVDELMALCDRLEADQADAEAAHAQLVQVLLDSLTQATDAADFRASWQRLSEHFHTLFTTEASIDALKQTVLQLAVMGKLVPQSAVDEPAHVLLRKIQAAFKAAPISEAGVMPLEDDNGQPMALPAGWSWALFGNICEIKSNLVRPEDFMDSQQLAPDCIEKGTGRIIESRTVRQSGVRGPNSRFVSGQIVYSKIRPSLSKAALVDFDGLCRADMYPLNSFISPSYQLQLMLSEVFLRQVRLAENRVKMPKLNQESLNAFVVPIPPLAEQHRIVAKVDELMALCDQLKAQLQAARQQHAQLASVLVEQAVSA